ncbi:P-loop containing nucleoside triphosphate hydrolase protein [Halteromyces radiatus]|uniref:P-loop containing nucleoside triphosphate hydrolase protein n=1 Tax=Halteromyces radiatus TaxID=101107 RepID=UPI00221F9B83|nr:P-loop containing nucleoside triphosphate hydrolase protein [Halteromyces radiatus]KAI8083038.1 P-loop containing nucleoside triphosphate hydrolase protein [Halteromyces radiatus]
MYQQQQQIMFSDLGLQPIVLQAVQKYLTTNEDLIRPTEIQALSIPTLLSPQHRHVLCAAETGSGKTLAYLLPVIQQLMVDEQKHGIKRRLDHPRALILVPTRELVSQVVKTCKQLSHTVKFRSLGVERVQRSKVIPQLASGPVDILVTTPTAMQLLLKQQMVSLADTRYMVMDEADSLFDAGWGEDCRQLIDTIQTIHHDRPRKEKMMIVSATLPRSVHTTLDKLFPHLVKITTPSLHRALPNLKQSFIDLQRFQGNRQLALLEVLKKNIKDEKTLVFCNTKKAVELVHQWLETKNVQALPLYKDAPIDRDEALTRFADKTSGDNVMISTDIASRGIDTTFVDHVILYDFPTSVVDYLHRVGRTARAGTVGKASSLIGRKDRMMADRIRRSIREGTVMT